jgi:restriction system protein
MPRQFFPQAWQRMKAAGNTQRMIEVAAAWLYLQREADKYDEQRESELRLRMTEIAAAERIYSECFENMRRVALGLCEPHIEILLRQRRQKIRKDAYGTEILDDWLAEVNYFVSRVLIPKLDPSCMVDWRVARDYLQNCSVVHGRSVSRPESAPPVFDDRGWMFELAKLVAAYVETRVTSETPEDVSDVRTPGDFETFCETLLAAAGWDARRVGCSGDQGADVIASRGELTAVFQCKLYSAPVGNSAVQEVHSARSFYGAQAAAVVSSSGLTKSAQQVAQVIGVSLLHPDELRTYQPKS